MKLAIGLSLVLSLTCLPALAQVLKPNFEANQVLSPAIPTAALEQWTPAPGREIVTVKTAAGVLRGWSYPGGAPGGPTLLIFGGSNNLILKHDGAYRAFARKAGRVVAFDYRGFGFSEGRPDAMDFRRDGLLIFDDVAKQAGGGERVVVLGYSLGSAIAGHVAAERKTGGLVLLAGLSNPVKMAELYSRNQGLVPTADALAFLDVTAEVRANAAPLLVVHGDKDVSVNVEEGRTNFAASRSALKDLVVLKDVDHEDMLERADVQQAVAAFLKRIS